MSEELKSTDKHLLLAALHSNGGGVDSDFYAEATRKRLMKRGLIQWKPNQHKSQHYSMLITLTAEGSRVAKTLTT